MVIPDATLSTLPDLQNEPDTRGVPLDKVGIRGYETPFKVLTKNNDVQDTVGKFDIYCNLGEEVKGANMSRFSQVISKALEKGNISMYAVLDMLAACKERLKASESFVRVDFPYFLEKTAPVSGVKSFSRYRSILEGRDTRKAGLQLFLTTYVEYMSLCPCSKKMSLVEDDDQGGVGRGAHNQRSTGIITVSLSDATLQNPEQFVWLEDLIDLVERQASCPIWNTLKRPDEQYVTEQSYKNPKFVEDVARDVSLELREWNDRVDGFIFISEHHESIHQYDAACVVRGGRVYIP